MEQRPTTTTTVPATVTPEDLQDARDEEGCFCFQVFGSSGIEARNELDVGDASRTGLVFQLGELVAVDLIRPSRNPFSENGPFLRLSDGSGWLFVQKQGQVRMRQIPVQAGLWAFYVDNFPAGQVLRKHPSDRPDLYELLQPKDKYQSPQPVTFLPQRKIYVDQKVTHPDTLVNYYRVQGTLGWVFDRREHNRMAMLLDASKVQEGLFIYKSLCGMSVRNQPLLTESHRSSRIVATNELVAVDLIRESPFSHGNGPFLRLTDGGWVFEKKQHKIMMEQVKPEYGSWSFKILVSMALRRHPISSDRMQYAKIFNVGENVLCNVKVEGADNITFYRVLKTDGWILDQRPNGQKMLELYWTGPSYTELDIEANQNGVGWTPDYVRGVAVSVEGMKEILFDPANRLLSFRGADSVRVNVYYSSKTVGTALQHPVHGRSQLYRRDCSSRQLVEILQDPRAHSGQSYKKTRKWNENPGILQSSLGPGIVVDEEEIVRTALSECDGEMTKLRAKKLELLIAAKKFDLEHAAKTKRDFEKYNELLES